MQHPQTALHRDARGQEGSPRPAAALRVSRSQLPLPHRAAATGEIGRVADGADQSVLSESRAASAALCTCHVQVGNERERRDLELLFAQLSVLAHAHEEPLSESR